MNYILIDEEKDDGSWHQMNNEMPARTSEVEVLSGDKTPKAATIVVEVSGWFLYFEKEGWGSLCDYECWRFRKEN